MKNYGTRKNICIKWATRRSTSLYIPVLIDDRIFATMFVFKKKIVRCRYRHLHPILMHAADLIKSTMQNCIDKLPHQRLLMFDFLYFAVCCCLPLQCVCVLMFMCCSILNVMFVELTWNYIRLIIKCSTLAHEVWKLNWLWKWKGHTHHMHTKRIMHLKKLSNWQNS